MKFILPLYILRLLLYLGCNNDKSNNNIRQEILLLDTAEKQKVFLEQIYDLDQAVRNHEAAVLQKHGMNSAEYQTAFQNMVQIDHENQQKIEAYLAEYGHPTLAIHSKKATSTPNLVIHHSADGVNIRKRNFPYFYKAYRSEDIDVEDLSFYLNRMYHIKYGHRIDWSEPFTVEQELDTLYKSLGLVEVVNKLSVDFAD